MSSLIIKSIKRKWRFFKIIEGVLYSVGIGLLVAALMQTLEIENFLLVLSLSFLSMVIWLLLFGVFIITDTEVARYLSKSYPNLQNSSELLLLNSSSLNIIEQLQRNRVEELIDQVSISPPVNLKIPIASLIVGVTVFFLASVFPIVKVSTEAFNLEPSISQPSPLPPILDPNIESLLVVIEPPVYSGIKLSRQNSLSIEALEGSNIKWEFAFNMPIDSASIVFSNGKELNLYKKADHFIASYKLDFNDFYYLKMKKNGKVKTTELYPIRVIKDQAPIIELARKEPFQEFEFGSISTTKIKAIIKDDFGINSSKIIATVAKGSGEGVKFREEEILFETSFKKGIKKVGLKKSLSLDSLGLEPGDELYFYVVSLDNKFPEPNISKSETYFLSITDTSDIEFSMVGNLGVDLMPEYFRSQRQIIIDTEKLIKSKAALSRHDFNFTSNELGFDQKVLRLKYGQFMGEELVSEAGGGIEDMENVVQNGEEAQLDEYTHAHDSENDHNLLEVNDIGEDLGHSHDNAEENTYFSLSVRAKLKEAMSQMWDAELYLRLYQPKKSLPYQYKALKLIKEIKNHARIYVQRMGFDPPPIKPLESRFKGKALEEILDSKVKNVLDENDPFMETRELLKKIARHFKTGESIESYIWQNTGNELAPMAIEEPGKFFSELNKIQKFRDENVLDYDMELKELYQSLSKLLPPASQLVNSDYVHSKWNQELMEQLKFNK